MNRKTIIAIVAAIFVVFVIYHLLGSRHLPTSAAGFSAPAMPIGGSQTNAAKPAETTIPTTEVGSADQKLVDQYTTQINSGKTDNGDAYLQRGLAYYRMKQYALAIDDFTTALKFAPKSSILFYYRGLAYQQSKLLDKAVADLTQAISLKEDYADAYNARGLAYVDQGNYQSAYTDYMSALKLNPKSSDVYFNLGTLYTREGKFDLAKAAFTSSITNNVPAANATQDQLAGSKKNLVETYINRANAEFQLQDYDSALKDATYAVTNDPHSIDALRIRSAIYEKMGNNAAAVADNATADNISMQQMLDTKH